MIEPVEVFAISRHGRQPSAHWLEVAESAKAHPGEWIPAGIHNASYTTKIKRGKITAFREGGFDAISRDIHYSGPSPKGTIYVRYLVGS